MPAEAVERRLTAILAGQADTRRTINIASVRCPAGSDAVDPARAGEVIASGAVGSTSAGVAESCHRMQYARGAKSRAGSIGSVACLRRRVMHRILWPFTLSFADPVSSRART